MKRLITISLAAALLLSGCAASSADASANEVAISEDQAAVIPGSLYNITGSSATETGDTEEALDEEITSDVQVQSAEAALPESGTQTVVEPKVTADLASTGSICTVFLQSADSVYSQDGTEIFVWQDTTVSIYTGSQDTDQWLAEELTLMAAESQEYRQEILDSANDQYAYVTEEGGNSDFYPYSYYVSASTERVDGQVLSLLTLSSVYLGGAHPDSWQQACNYDLCSCKKLSLSDVIQTGQEQRLLEAVLENLESSLGTISDMTFFEDYQEVVTESITGASPTENWYFSEDGLVIYYNNYDIAPYAAGIIQVELSYQSLDGILEPEFVPETRSGISGALVQVDGTDDSWLRLDLRSGDTSYSWEYTIGVEGTVYDIQMYQISSWLTDETLILGDMLCSASQADSGNQITIVSDQTSENAYLILWRTGAGETQTSVLDCRGLRTVSVYSNK